VVYSTETEVDVESEPNLTLDNQALEVDIESESAFVVVKLEMPDSFNSEPFNHRNVAHDDDTTCDDYMHIMEYKRICFKHEYKYEEYSTHVMSHAEEARNSVFVKSEMPFDSEMSTTQFPHDVPDSPGGKVKTEVNVHQYLESGDVITHDDTQHSVVCKMTCLKHEYKDEQDSSPAMAPNISETVCTTAIDKHYRCHTCTKSFSSNSRLKQHVRIHTGGNRTRVKYVGNCLHRRVTWSAILKCTLVTNRTSVIRVASPLLARVIS
jgi:hypothetical protein